MKDRGTVLILSVVSFFLLQEKCTLSFDFGMRNRQWRQLPPPEGRAKVNALAFRRKKEEEDDGQRRRLLGGSTMSLLSAFVATFRPESVEAVSSKSSTVILEDSEARRIGIFEKNAPSVVFIDTFVEKQDAFSPNTMEVPLGSGSGFVWDKQGHIVTNYHVVRNSKFAQVAIITPKKAGQTVAMIDPKKAVMQPKDTDPIENVFAQPASMRQRANSFAGTEYQRTVYKAEVVGVDPGKDIAVLKVDAPKEILYPIAPGSSTGLRVGQTAIAIGNPFGLDHTLTTGVISGTGREVKSPIGRPITNVIQTDAAINPGNSGGPLLDSMGTLIGMNTAIYSTSGTSSGISFAVPVDTVKYIVDTLIRDGKVVRPILGISYLESKQARALGIGRGVLVLDVPDGSTAAKAGLRGTRRTETGLVEIGDIIVQVGKVVINTEANLFQALEDFKPGETVEVRALRVAPGDGDTLKQKEVRLSIELQSSEMLKENIPLLQSR